jgi:hypothetical protein
MYWIQSTVGQKEVHSRDGLDYILHTGERSWTIVWRGEPTEPSFETREGARKVIRSRKKTGQLSLFQT